MSRNLKQNSGEVSAGKEKCSALTDSIKSQRAEYPVPGMAVAKRFWGPITALHRVSD